MAINVIETWRDVIGYEGIYIVSDIGNVKNVKSGRQLKYRPDKDGYNRLKLYNGITSSDIRVHRMVATAFIDNPDCKPVVNHKDGDKTNNCVDNLEWVTHVENCRHASDMELNYTKFTHDDIRDIRNFACSMTYIEVAVIFGTSIGFVSDVCNYNKCKGVLP